MQLLRAENHVTVPWRNGGGTTREIAVHREAERHDDFLWRLSLATVAQAGPFSRFAGVDRSIALVTGAGMSLSAPDAVTLVTADSPPFAFRGETEIECALLDGVTVDLNAMTRRGFFDHVMRRQSCLGRTTIEGLAARTFVVFTTPMRHVAPEPADLAALDTLVLAPGETVTLEAAQPAAILVVELSAAS